MSDASSLDAPVAAKHAKGGKKGRICRELTQAIDVLSQEMRALQDQQACEGQANAQPSTNLHIGHGQKYEMAWKINEKICVSMRSLHTSKQWQGYESCKDAQWL
eukprot:scaffold831_cov19-Tisochrysis_lutea.AAC.1